MLFLQKYLSLIHSSIFVWNHGKSHVQFDDLWGHPRVWSLPLLPQLVTHSSPYTAVPLFVPAQLFQWPYYEPDQQTFFKFFKARIISPTHITAVLLTDKSEEYEINWGEEVDGAAGIPPVPPKALYCLTTITQDTFVLCNTRWLLLGTEQHLNMHINRKNYLQFQTNKHTNNNFIVSIFSRVLIFLKKQLVFWFVREHHLTLHLKNQSQIIQSSHRKKK